MKVLILADPNSPHTIKWVTSLAQYDFTVFLLGLSDYNPAFYNGYSNIEIETLGFNSSVVRRGEAKFIKFLYLKSLFKLRRAIKTFNPDILHAYYATSYGLIGALSNFHPYVISVWGSDVFSFPHKSVLHSSLLRFNLARAERVFSTSHAMARETQSYTKNEVKVIPFGVDVSTFKPYPTESLFDSDSIVIGTIKTLEATYGIDSLIQAFKILKEKHRHLPLKLLIVGGGSQEQNLKSLVKNLKLEQDTLFTGRIDPRDVPKYCNMLSIYVAVSNRESFGVAVVEASACEKPVVVSRVGGLPEVVEDGVSGFIVEPRNPQQTADALEPLVLSESLRHKMGKAGRTRVETLFNWEDNVKQMVNAYHHLIAKVT